MNAISNSSAVGMAYGQLAALMPMHIVLSREGDILSVGPTLGKIAGALVGARFFAHCKVHRPIDVETIDALRARTGERLHILIGPDHEISLRGIATTSASGEIVMNLSFGIDLPEAVRRHRLTDGDFAPTDLAIELLYLLEVKSLVTAELHGLNSRLEGAKNVAELQAHTDTLTGLHNRRALDSQLSSLVATSQPFGLMHLDLDYFKAVNDTLGHAAGDHVLINVAKVLRSETRKNDTVARVGGDEFVVLLPGLVDVDRLFSIASRIIEMVNKPMIFEGNRCNVSASIGMTISTIYTQPLSTEQILADADHALYVSKRAGRGRATAHRACDIDC